MKKTFIKLMPLALTMAMLSGCGGQASPAPTTAATTTAVSEAPAQTEAASSEASSETGTRTVTDMAGRKVELSGEINRIGTLGSVGVLNAFVELMGSGDKLYNEMPASFTKNDSWKMQYEFAPQIADGPLFESDNREVLIENIIQAAPDVCFTMTKDTAELLENNNIPCIYLEWKDVEDVKTAVSLMGEVLNKKDMAEKYIAYFDEKMAQAQELTKDLKDEDKVTVLYGNPVTFSQPHVIAEWWITQAGGMSVTNDGRSDNSLEYTMEDLLKWNPDVMIVSNAGLIDEIKANSNYSGITAVKNDAFHVIPTVAHVWGNRTVEQPLTVFWTMHHLYPELMPREELEKEIKYFYSEFFLYDVNDEQIDEMIGR